MGVIRNHDLRVLLCRYETVFDADPLLQSRDRFLKAEIHFVTRLSYKLFVSKEEFELKAASLMLHPDYIATARPASP